MKEHFNEKYLESEKYPKATFQGKLQGFDLYSQEVQTVVAQGKLTLHGVTKSSKFRGRWKLNQTKLLRAHSLKLD